MIFIAEALPPTSRAFNRTRKDVSETKETLKTLLVLLTWANLAGYIHLIQLSYVGRRFGCMTAKIKGNALIMKPQME